jgi:hypothetical protein
MGKTTLSSELSQQPFELFGPRLLFWFIVVITVHRVAYLLFFHPLRHIPGPWSTRLCGWYEFYTNIWLDGQWCKTYPDLHKKYGTLQDGHFEDFEMLTCLKGSPVVRVGPDHVHIKDIDAYEKFDPTNDTMPKCCLTITRVFRNGTQFDKDHVFYTCADNDGSIFSLSNRDEHRARRKALSPRFSKKAAEADAPAILNQIRLLEGFMIRHSSLGKSCNVSDLFRAFGVSHHCLIKHQVDLD